MNKKDQANLKEITEFIKSKNIMTLATHDKDLWNKSHKLKVDTIPLKDVLEKVIKSKVWAIKPTRLKMFGAVDGDEKEIVVDF